MADQYTCYVPKEWKVYPEQFIKDTVADKAINQWKHCRHMEGTTIRLENTTAKFNYYRFGPWMRKSDDKSQHPCANEYYGIKMNCILCSKMCRNFGHRVCNHD